MSDLFDEQDDPPVYRSVSSGPVCVAIYDLTNINPHEFSGPIQDKASGLKVPVEPDHLEKEWSFIAPGSLQSLFALVKEAFEQENIDFEVYAEKFQMMGNTALTSFQLSVYLSKEDDEHYVVELRRRSGDLVAFRELFQWLESIASRSGCYLKRKSSSSSSRMLNLQEEATPSFISSLSSLSSSTTLSMSDRIPPLQALLQLSQISTNAAAFKESSDDLQELLDCIFDDNVRSAAMEDPGCDEFLRLGIAFAANMVFLFKMVDLFLTSECVRALMDCIRMAVTSLALNNESEHGTPVSLLALRATQCLISLAQDKRGLSLLLPHQNDIKELVLASASDVSISFMVDNLYAQVCNS